MTKLLQYCIWTEKLTNCSRKWFSSVTIWIFELNFCEFWGFGQWQYERHKWCNRIVCPFDKGEYCCFDIRHLIKIDCRPFSGEVKWRRSQKWSQDRLSKGVPQSLRPVPLSFTISKRFIRRFELQCRSLFWRYRSVCEARQRCDRCSQKPRWPANYSEKREERERTVKQSEFYIVLHCSSN